MAETMHTNNYRRHSATCEEYKTDPRHRYQNGSGKIKKTYTYIYIYIYRIFYIKKSKKLGFESIIYQFNDHDM